MYHDHFQIRHTTHLLNRMLGYRDRIAAVRKVVDRTEKCGGWYETYHPPEGKKRYFDFPKVSVPALVPCSLWDMQDVDNFQVGFEGQVSRTIKQQSLAGVRASGGVDENKKGDKRATAE